MDRALLVCKHCNQAFSRRDQLEQHIKTHSIETPPQKIVFYNNPEQLNLQQPLTAPMNFYTESLQLLQPKTEYPIMNQLLSGNLLPNLLQPTKNFVCGVCGSTFFKKKELDRHVLSIHTNLKQFSCETCPKVFNRRDKLLRHEKTHNVANVFNCPLCPAVFMRQQMLDLHSKVHNGEQQAHSQLESFLASFQQPVENNGVSHNNSSMDVEVSHQLMSALLQVSVPETKLLPMNLSISKSEDVEPMNLSSDRIEPKSILSITKVEKSPARITIDSDDDEGLRIVEETPIIKKSPSLINLHNLPNDQPIAFVDTPVENGEIKQQFDEPMNDLNSMTSRIANLEKLELEPLRDLPMEILNND